MKVVLKSYGCQMNFYDSEVAHGLLSHAGFEVIHEGENGIKGTKEADIVIMNTCSVREHAEERVFGNLRIFGQQKEKNPNMIIGLMGCMVEEHREKLFQKYPQLDLMVGTRNIKELPALIDEVRRTRKQVSKIKQEGISIEYTDKIKRVGTHHGWLPIMTGCDKICTYCIVPITRGAEVSMPAREVYREVSRLVDDGVKWITLLGQNVNSYRGEEVGRPSIDFPELLNTLCQIEGLDRISFTTSHPQDATEELFQVIAKNPKISRRFHLPLQSGSDRILRRMKRLHTFAEYESKIERLRELVPDISITTDIIAGFSGETAEDHEATCEALRKIGYDDAFIYKYSLRPGTPAANLEDDVPQSVKESRNQELLKIQKEKRQIANERWLGREAMLFVSGTSPKSRDYLIGRIDQEKRVVFSGDSSLIGNWIKIKLTELRNETFFGVLV